MRVAAALLLLFAALPVEAQLTTRRPVRRGDVTGVELQIEGALAVRRGSELRWYLTAYEVVGLDRLRPAAGAEITVATSLTPGEPSAEVTADARGRALVSFAVPDDAPAAFGANVRVHARRGVSRRFDLQVRTSESRAIEVHAAPQVRQGGSLAVFGRYHRVDGRAIADAPITLQAYDGRGPIGSADVRTDAQGVFTSAFEVPDDAVAPLRIEARGPRDEEERQVAANAQAALSTASEPPLVVSVGTDSVLTRPGTRVPVQVVVRRADGRPVEGARVRIGHQPVPLTEEERGEDVFVRTDARGRASLEYRAPSFRRGHRDVQVQVQAGRAGIGRGAGNARLRVTAESHHVSIAVEGGALVPTLQGRLFAEVVAADGSRAGEGVQVHIEGPRIGSHDVTTDASGVARAEMRVGPKRDGDRCGGDAVTAVDVRVGSGQTSQLCIPVDPDAATAVRLSTALTAPGQAIGVEVQRVAAAARLPVSVVAFVQSAGGLVPVAAEVLAARDDSTQIEIPAHVPPGMMLVRARPLVGNDQQEARGGFNAFYVVPETELGTTLRVSGGNDRLGLVHEIQGSQSERTTLAVAWPLGWSGFGMPRGNLDDSRGGRITSSIAATQLARRTPLDLAASIRLRGRDRSAAPEPTNPEQLGLLRDPWRASARFVEGRLALVFRAIEARVDQAVPDQMEDVSVQQRGRFRFNRQLLASLTDGSLGSAGATGLGGEPLTIERLEALDRAFDYDHVAMRITRRRLFKILLALRTFVQQQALDLAWTRPGDPTLWLERIRNRHAPGVGQVRPGDLVDGWGRPFELRATARPRFTRLQPVAGYELVSAGPDGRFGNRDDLVDPTARVLPTGSLYGRAVGEDGLVARLQGVELGRATLAMASQVFGARQVGIPAPQERPQGARLGDLPALIEADRWALALRRPTKPTDALLTRIDGGEASLAIDAEPRTWRVASVTYTRSGTVSVAEDGARAGAPLISDLVLPTRLRVNEPLRFALHVTDVTDEGGTFAVVGRGEGVGVQVASQIVVGAGQTQTVPVTLNATTPGRGSVEVELMREGTTLRRVRERVSVDRGLHPIRRRAVVLLGNGGADIDFPAPAGAQGRVVVVSPRALTADPDFADMWREDPALIAWSEALAGRSLEPALRARLLRAQEGSGLFRGREPALSTAAAITALSGLFDDRGRPDAEAGAVRARAVGRLAGLPAFADRDGNAGRLRMQASVLAALATSGVSDYEAASSHDPVGQTLRGWLPSLRRALRDVPGEPSLLARSAAALLLADPRDGHGRAMFARVRESLEEAPGGLRVVPSSERGGAQESLHATLAASLAAHQLGEDELARKLLAHAARSTPDIARNGGEAAFWWLAAAAYGAFGADVPNEARVRIDGTTHTLSLAEGSGAVAFSGGGERSIRADGDQGPVLLRAEAVFGRGFTERNDAPLRVTLAGEPGAIGSLAALELSIRAEEAVGAPVLDVQLPAAVEADERFLRRLEANAAVRRAEKRKPGFVRLWLAPLADEAEATIPLPLLWQAEGSVRGLGVVAYAADRPDRMTVVAPRDWTIGPEE